MDSQEKQISNHTYHQTPSDGSPHVFRLLCYVAVLDILGAPVRKEQHYVEDDGQHCQRVQGNGDEAGTFSGAHGVILLDCLRAQVQSEVPPESVLRQRGRA